MFEVTKHTKRGYILHKEIVCTKASSYLIKKHLLKFSRRKLSLIFVIPSTSLFYASRVRPEGGFKNRNRIPDLPKHNSGSYYRNQNIFFDIPVPVNPEPEFQIIAPVPAKPEPEIGFTRILAGIYRN